MPCPTEHRLRVGEGVVVREVGGAEPAVGVEAVAGPAQVAGGGEGGRMMAPGVVSAAIEDALRSYNVSIDELPITPNKILRWIGEGSKA
mgnify:CR=1 FL=1